MEARIDSVGRILLPKALRDALGLVAGASVDVSLYGSGLQLVPSGRTARLRKVDGVLAADSDTVITDDDVYTILDAGRR
jgi:AbrB family looped-hinge helix DNA binding protein